MRTAGALAVGLVVTAVFQVGCGSDQVETRNTEQIYAEEGVPVRVATVELTEFRTEFTYTATLTGIRESSAYAAIADRVAAIHVKVGDRVAKDDVIISFPTDNPAAQYYQAKVSFENARTSHERIENLYASGGVSRQALDNSQAAREVAEANWDAVRQAVEVKAPIDGVVTKIDVQESDNVEEDVELFTIARLDTMKARVWVAEKDVAEFIEGLPATARWNDRVLAGRVTQVDMSINRDRQAFGVVIAFDNPGIIAMSGITVDLTIATYSNPHCVVIDRKYIQNEDGRSVVYVAADGAAMKRRVSTGRTQGARVEVRDGLVPGELLIVEGQMLLEDGAKVKIITAPPPPGA